MYAIENLSLNHTMTFSCGQVQPESMAYTLLYDLAFYNVRKKMVLSINLHFPVYYQGRRIITSSYL